METRTNEAGTTGMMQQILDYAAPYVDEAEVYFQETKNEQIGFEQDQILTNPEISQDQGVALRIIKNNTLGFSYTKNVLNYKQLVQHALDSLQAGIAASYHFPEGQNLSEDLSSASNLRDISSEKILDDYKTLQSYLLDKKEVTFEVIGILAHRVKRIMNTKGSHLSNAVTFSRSIASVTLFDSFAGVDHIESGRNYTVLQRENLDELVRLYEISKHKISVPTKKMKVIFSPSAMYALLWRFHSAVSAQAIHENISPLQDKMGTAIFDKRISIYDDPHHPLFMNGCSFDDEGSVIRRRPFVERGVLTSFAYDLNYASLLSAQSTANGFKGEMFGGEPLGASIRPAIPFMVMEKGDTSLETMIHSVDEGILVHSVLGAHSGNLMNGDLSVGISSGFFIQNGMLVGSVSDCLISGNVYSMLNQVEAVGSEQEDRLFMGISVPILLDQISVTGNS